MLARMGLERQLTPWNRPNEKGFIFGRSVFYYPQQKPKNLFQSVKG